MSNAKGRIGRLGRLGSILVATFALAMAAHAAGTFALSVDGTLRSDAAGARARAVAGALAPLPIRPSGDANPSWRALGPFGADVSAIAASPVDPQHVYAGIAPDDSVGGTLYESTDGGATWAEVPAFHGTSVFAIAFAPDGHVYLGAQDGVHDSGDGGLTWNTENLGIGINNAVFALAIDPSDPLTLWAGITSALGGQPVNVMRSDDGGATWNDMTPPAVSGVYSGTGIAVSPSSSDTVVAVFSGDFGGGAVFVTADGGATWDDRTGSLPANPMRAVAFAGNRLLVGGGQLFGSEYVGLYASDDLGATWDSLSDSWPLAVVSAIAVDPVDDQHLIVATDGAGVNTTGDGGTTWQTGVDGTAGVAALAVQFAPDTNVDVYVGARSLGVLRSLDGGDSFTTSSDGISQLALYSIAANPLDTSEIAVAFQGLNNGGVYTSIDGGTTWFNEPVPGTRYSAVGFAPDGTLYAISSGPTSIAQEGLYRRNPDDTWTLLGPDQGPQFESNLADMLFSPDDPNLILLGGGDFGVAGFGSTIWRSDDAGTTWTKVYLGADFDFVTDIDRVADGQDQTFIAAYDDTSGANLGGALRSADGGVTWDPALNGLPSGYLRTPMLCAVAGAPQSFFLSLATSSSVGSLYRTDDTGATWQATGWSGTAPVDVVCDAADPQTLYTAAYGAVPASRSIDGGVTFAPFDSGLDGAGTPVRLAVAHADGSAAETILMATGSGSYAVDVETVDDTIFADGFDE